MQPDKDLSFLDVNYLEMLQKLARNDYRSEVEEIKWLIWARAVGRLKDLGDDRISPQVSRNDLSEVLQVKNIRIGSAPTESDDPDHPIQPRSR